MPVVPATRRPAEAPFDAADRRLHGTVLWFDAAKGFGFIVLDEQPRLQVFVEFSVIDHPGYRTLRGKQRVTLLVECDERGPHAAVVRTLSR